MLEAHYGSVLDLLPHGVCDIPILFLGAIFDYFFSLSFNDQEIVALSGAHALGRAHTDRYGSLLFMQLDLRSYIAVLASRVPGRSPQPL